MRENEVYTNFIDSNGIDLGKKLITKSYLMDVYPNIGQEILDLTSEIWVWGKNTDGQLGINSKNSPVTPIPNDYTGIGWKQISIGYNHTAAVKTDGTLWTWGNGDNGRLGINATTNRSTPVTTFVGGTNWKQVSAGSNHTIAVKTDGTLWTWGYNSTGQLGINATTNRSTPVQTSAAGTNWVQCAAGAGGSAAIKEDGTLWTWGSSGLLGTNQGIARSTPGTTLVGGTNWKKVSLDNFGVGSKTDGTLWVWGSGQLGHTTPWTKNTPVTTFLGGTNWTDLATGAAEELFTISASRHNAISSENKGFGFAIKAGALWGWGTNYLANLGTNDTRDRSTPVQTAVGGTNWRQVEGGRTHTIATKTDSTLWCWGDSTSGQVGANFTGVYFQTPVTTFFGGAIWKQGSAGSSHSAAVRTNGTLWTWGANSWGQLGNNDPLFGDKSRPVTTFAGGTNWKQVSCGGSYTTAIKTDGTLWTWGRNVTGSLGTNDATDRYTPVTTFAGGIDWTQVSAGYKCTAAIKTDGTLWLWGSYEALGIGADTTDRYTPITTFAGGTNWKQVSVGNEHAAAIKTDGTLWTWGNSFSGPRGELGTNDTFDRNTPVTTFLGGTDWTQVSAGYNMTYALKGSGASKELYVFGDAALGQLGNNFSQFYSYVPIEVEGNSTEWQTFSYRRGLIMAIKTDGTLWQARAVNPYPNYFITAASTYDIFTTSVTPVTVFGGATNWKQTSVGDYHVSAIKTDGTLWTWGYNDRLRGSLKRSLLGTNDFQDKSTPVTTFVGGTNWKQVVSSTDNTIAIKTQDII